MDDASNFEVHGQLIVKKQSKGPPSSQLCYSPTVAQCRSGTKCRYKHSLDVTAEVQSATDAGTPQSTSKTVSDKPPPQAPEVGNVRPFVLWYLFVLTIDIYDRSKFLSSRLNQFLVPQTQKTPWRTHEPKSLMDAKCGYKSRT